jgi:glycosyltransferase involved in cell wall biosynthesis
MEDYFLNIIKNRGVVWNEFYELLDYINPDIVHFHHYIHIGIEHIKAVKNWAKKNNKKIKTLLTLHEYIAICANNGQMIKTTNGKLCYESNPIDCNRCFNNIPTTQFKLREIFYKAYFDEIDLFIAPSYFLKDRYVKWGIKKDKIYVLDNGQPIRKKLPKRELKEGENRRIFAYFGQINPFKGLDILLESLDFIPKGERKDILIYIFGSGLENQPIEFQQKIKTYMNKYSKNIKYFGPYESEELGNLMKNVDYVVMPSIWWENSPLVIQEALSYGRPLLVSNIGGMAEKVKHLETGVHFQYKNPLDLANWIIKCKKPEFYDKLYENIKEPLSLEKVAKKHIELYHA